MTYKPNMGEQAQLLLVDDCVAERDLYEVTLTPEFKVLTAGRGEQGLAMARRERPHAIVLDVMMPGMDGWETCTRIKCDAVTADIPVILFEITDVNREYLDRGELQVERFARGIAWLDTGTHEALMQASSFIQAIEERQGLMVACLEEIAYRQGYITAADLACLARRLGSSAYGEYLSRVLEQEQ